MTETLKIWFVRQHGIIIIRTYRMNSRPIAIVDQTGIVYNVINDDIQQNGDTSHDCLYTFKGDFSDCNYVVVRTTTGEEYLGRPLHSSTISTLPFNLMTTLMIPLKTSHNNILNDVEHLYITTTTTVLQQFDAIFSLL